MAKFRSKVVEVEAWEILKSNETGEIPSWILNYTLCGKIYNDMNGIVVVGKNGTTEGGPGDFIINLGNDDIYICKRDVFMAKYEYPSI